MTINDRTVNAFDQDDGTACTLRTGLPWHDLVDTFYPETRNSIGFERRGVYKADITKENARNAGDGSGHVIINWGGVGIWRSVVYRCVPGFEGEPINCNTQVVFNEGFHGSCRCVPTYKRDRQPNSLRSYVINVINPGGVSAESAVV